MAESSVPDVGKHRKAKRGKNHPPNTIYEEVNVLVTGSGTSKDHLDESAWWVAQALPNVLPTDQNHMSRIRIIVCEEPVPHTYVAARTFLEEYLGRRPETTFMLVLHLCASATSMSADGYKLQKYARRNAYEIKDGNGAVPSGMEELEYWARFSPQARTTARLEDVLPRWQGEVAKNGDEPDDNLGISENAGHGVCEYLFFASLTYTQNQKEVNDLAWQDRTTVEVCHIPKITGTAAIEKAKAVVVGLIYALIDSRRSRDGDFEDDHQAAQQYQKDGIPY